MVKGGCVDEVVFVSGCGVDVRGYVTVEVLRLVEPLGHEGQGTVTVVNDVWVLHVDVTVLRPPVQVVQGTTTVVT